MFKSPLAVSTLPFLAIALVACSSPAPQSDQTDQAPVEADTDPFMEQSGATDSLGNAALTREAIETARFAAPATPQPTGEAPKATPDPAVIRAQILLDRARFSPGVIDGLGGDNTRRALAAFERAHGLSPDGILDAEVFEKLASVTAGQVLADYRITAEDVAGPFIGDTPQDMEALAGLSHVGYRSPIEGLAEKFHMTEGLLRALNPGVDFSKPGQALLVAAVSEDDLTTDVAEVRVDKQERSVRVLDGQGQLLAFYPATIGSTARPAPDGTLEVINLAPNPNYTYDPSRVSYGKGERKLIIQPGPNNPVGSVWIGLSRDTYGIHGTPDPSKVGKTFSSGCIRLTNWDAQQLASKIKPGVRVVIG